ncbi:MAG: sulfite exporter TauE/SafE family protein [Acidobacteriota bacterium]
MILERVFSLLAAGMLAGIVNVLAGGGSFLTLPLLIFMGLPATVANGTNRVGILFQNIGAVAAFHHHGVVPWRLFSLAVAPATAGALLGAAGALLISDAALQRTLALLMVVVTLYTLWNPLGHRQHTGRPAGGTRPWLTVTVFFLVGVYGGFIQAGAGFFLLAAATLAGLDLVRGNALKVLCALVFTAATLILFVWQGKVYWTEGLSLAGGTLAGGQIGVRLTVLKGHAWVRGVVTVTVILLALKLWLAG